MHSTKTQKNHDYFEKIDTPNKAYIVGYLCADGSIREEVNKITFCINSKDRKVLEFIKEELEMTNVVSDRIVFDKRTNKEYNQSSLQFSSLKMKQDLEKLGVSWFKSSYLEIPNLPEEYMADFIRGYFDGDGYIDGKGRLRCTVIGTLEFIKGWKQFFQQKGIHWTGEYNVGEKQYRCCLNTNEQVIKFYEFLYADEGFHLERKYLSFRKAIDIYENRPPKGYHQRKSVEVCKEGNCEEFDSIKQAANFIKCSPTTIVHYLKKRKVPKNGKIKGFIIKYTDDDRN